MLPSEFIERYGKPRLSTLSLSGGVAVVLPPDDSRVVLTLLSCSAQIAYGPFSGSGIPPTFVAFDGSTGPVTFTHALHASIVNMSWLFSDTGAASTLTIIEVFMRKNTPPITRIWEH